MIKHIVLLEFKPSATSEEITHLFFKLSILQGHISSVRSFSYGQNTSPEQLNKGFNHAFIMEFENTASRDAYLAHPEHKNVAQQVIFPLLRRGKDSIIVLDYEF
ncbi:Dabb family protein [Legionella impletisoli]|uniref:Stress responsive protein n=1 Tax=Legionella impletisoli TaxID=343510 RepID=A0A917N9H9_9GAMM|nr:Dabb family protein [Legionella impletisoli]GGI80435.1 stress responsive protein [Legionella impletisoli]